MNAASQAALDRLSKKAGQHVMRQALELQGEWIDTLSTPGTGRQYGAHTASAPGDPPAVDSGLLRQSVQAAQLGPLTWATGISSTPYPDGGATTAEVAVWQEYGTRTVAARPHARPSLDRWKAKRAR